MVNKPKSSAKSPARRPSTPSRRSPTRSQSPARKSPARKKSPSRMKRDSSPPPIYKSKGRIASPKPRTPISKSPSRKSPPRAAKSATASYNAFFTEKSREETKNKRNRIETDSDSDSDSDVIEIKEKPKAAVRGRSRLDIESSLQNKSLGSAFNAIKRTTRTSQTREEERVVHLKHFDVFSKKLGTFSDDDDTMDIRKSQSVDKAQPVLKSSAEFGGTLGSLFYIIALPLSTIALFIVCNESQCSFTKVPRWRNFLALSVFYNTKSFMASVLFLTSIALLSGLPFGGKKVIGMPNRQGRLDYIVNGPFVLLITLATLIGLEFRGIPIAQFITGNIVQLSISFTIIGILMSIYLYMRSFYVPVIALNAHTINHGPIYAFFMGRELNPRVLNVLDLKMYAFRVSVIGSMLLDFAFLYNSLGLPAKTIEPMDLKSLTYRPTLILMVVLHTIYFLDPLIRESAWVTTFEIQYEGFGYMGAVGYLLYPFMIGVGTKYVADHHVELDVWQLCLSGVVFIIGLILFSGANSQKDAFRKNPYNPALAHLETIPTTQGKKLLVSGFWGIVRHPNYLGDILMNLAMSCFVLTVPPIIIFFSIVLLLIHRTVRDHARCKQKYGAAWDRYCSRVKYVLIPKVY